MPAWRLPASASAVTGSPKNERDVFLDGAYRTIPVHDRDRLAPGARIAGPAIVEERESTVVVTPAFDLAVDASLNVVLGRTRA